MLPTLGSTVLYTLSADDVHAINDPLDQAFTGGPGRRNPVSPGQTLAARVVAVNGSAVNLKVDLDGYGVHWATSRVEGDTPGTWARPT